MDVEPIPLAEARRIGLEPVLPELVAAPLATARSLLENRLEGGDHRLTGTAIDEFVHWYSMKLAQLTNLVIVQRYASFRLTLDPLWRPRPASAGDAGQGASRVWLDRYVDWEDSEALLSPDGPYPELGRLIERSCADWLAAVVEVIDRVDRHWGAIAALAGEHPRSLPPLSGAEFGISDPHGGGRSAAILSFGHHKVVYKPRGLSCEEAWSRIASHVVPRALGVPMPGYGIVTMPGYGFMEFVDHASCADEEAVARCYRRYGALLAIAHMLGTCDLHHENIIVRGEYPLVIDAEPLLRCRLKLSASGGDRLNEGRDLIEDGVPVRVSVLETGMLPGLMPSHVDDEPTMRPVEQAIGALSAFGHDPIWDFVPCGRGSDELQMRKLPIVASTFQACPISTASLTCRSSTWRASSTGSDWVMTTC